MILVILVNLIGKILIRFSPISLFRFKFHSEKVKNILEVLTSFLGNWKDRHSILLHAYSARGDPKNQQLKDLLQSYKVKCIIKKYETCGGFEDFEWINKLGTIL
ncbi:unnamed protein product [Rhizophagus irregularis]|nr:unnamed protein product [Rhizophagus irregularis]